MSDTNNFNNDSVNNTPDQEPVYAQPVYKEVNTADTQAGGYQAAPDTQQGSFQSTNYGQNGYQGTYPMDYQMSPEPKDDQIGFSVASLILGICGFSGILIACCGYVTAIPGLVLGILGMKKGGKGLAIAGIVLSAITLLISIVNSVLGVLVNLGTIAL